MPANLSPDYMRLEKQLRDTRDAGERLIILQEMLRVIPKHKGTDKMQADLKRRISKMEQAAQQKSQKSGKDLYHVAREGAGQVLLAGPPNVGKSRLMDQTTRAAPQVANYPFTTHLPQPGMVIFEDIQIQLVDTPPLSRDYVETALFNTFRVGDLILLVADLSDPDPSGSLLDCLAMFEEHHLMINPRAEAEQDGSASVMEKRAIIWGNKIDLAPTDAAGALRDDFSDYRVLVGSAETGEGLEALAVALFEELKLIRIYTKKPGHKFEKGQPFVLHEGATVIDAARVVHKDFAENLKFAKLWGSGKHQGLSVPRDHVLADGDILEIHAG